MKEFDAIIIGCGPAGISSAIYLSRAGKNVLVLGKKENSWLYKAHRIENYFGFPKGIEGKELLELGTKQAKRFGAVLLEEEAVSAKKENSFFLIQTPKNSFKSKTLILAFGSMKKKSGIKGEEQFVGKGVSYCVACDGFFAKDKKAIVIGSTDFAAIEAIELSDYTKDITIFSNGEKFSLNPELAKKLKEKIIPLKEEKIAEFGGKNFLEYTITHLNKKIPCSFAFISLPSTAQKNFTAQLGVELKDGFIAVDSSQKTSAEGIFAAGECCNSKQAITSAAQGAVAALSVLSFMQQKRSQKNEKNKKISSFHKLQNL